MKPHAQINAVLVGLAIAGASIGALAQTTTTAPMGSASAPAAVGVTSQSAAEANRQAVPRSDTATVVRTGPNAVDASRSAASAAQGSTSSMGARTGTGTGTTMRPPKADRN